MEKQKYPIVIKGKTKTTTSIGFLIPKKHRFLNFLNLQKKIRQPLYYMMLMGYSIKEFWKFLKLYLVKNT